MLFLWSAALHACAAGIMARRVRALPRNGRKRAPPLGSGRGGGIAAQVVGDEARGEADVAPWGKGEQPRLVVVGQVEFLAFMA